MKLHAQDCSSVRGSRKDGDKVPSWGWAALGLRWLSQRETSRMAYEGQRPPDTHIPAVGGQAAAPRPAEKRTSYVLGGCTSSPRLPLRLRNLVQAKCSAWVTSQTGNSFRFLPWLPSSSPSFPEAFLDPEKLQKDRCRHINTPGHRASQGPQGEQCRHKSLFLTGITNRGLCVPPAKILLQTAVANTAPRNTARKTLGPS